MPQGTTWSDISGLEFQIAVYAVSFFWIGSMWISIHGFWQKVEKNKPPRVVGEYYYAVLCVYAAVFHAVFRFIYNDCGYYYRRYGFSVGDTYHGNYFNSIFNYLPYSGSYKYKKKQTIKTENNCKNAALSGVFLRFII